MTLSGRVTYDRVPFAVARNGLDYAATFAKPVREADVELIQSNQAVLGTTRTDTDGRYQFTAVPAATDVFVRVHARTRNGPASSAGWDIEVRDNTNANAQYVLDGAVFNTGAADGTPTRDLNAPSGWPQFGGAAYVAPRSAGPFAILDTMYEALQLVFQQGDPDLSLQPLAVFWSPNNRPADGDPADGNIGTTSYVSAGAGIDPGIYVLGSDGVDTDEYDEHVLAHEFNHFLEDTVARADSPGGPHSTGERLDMRVAWSEGMSNAFSAMALGDPVYRDSFDVSQSDDFGFDMNDNVHANAGWFSEASVYSIAWDLFDDDVESNDTIALGYAPLFDVLRTEIRTTTALTSLFPFLTALKLRPGVDTASVDAIVQAQDIVAAGMDAFASTETHDGGIPDALPVYTDITLNAGTPVAVCVTGDAGVYNALANRRYLKFSVPSERAIDILVTNAGLPRASFDPDLVLWHSGFFAISQCVGVDPPTGCTEPQDRERYQSVVPAGDYVLEVYDYNLLDPNATTRPRACLNVTVNG